MEAPLQRQVYKLKIQEVLENLLEMNPDAKGDCLEISHQKFIDEKISELSNYTFVISDEQQFEYTVSLSKHCEKLNIPLLSIRSFGLIGYLRIYMKCFSSKFLIKIAFQTKGEHEKYDLRLSKPFPQLQTIADKIDMNSLDKKEFKFVPFLVVLIKELEKWRKEVFFI